jgi:hypothetical protein
MSRLLAYIRERPEVGFFALATVIFVAGIATFLAGRDGDAESEPKPSRAPPGTPRVGPNAGEAIPAYIQKKKADLEKAAAERRDETRFAVVSFIEYRKPKDVDDFLRGKKFSALTAQWRVPRPDFQPAEVGVSSDLTSALAPEIKKVIRARREELDGLEGYINSAGEDPAAVAVFREDAERVRETIQFLEADPPLVYAVVVRAANAALADLLKAPEVRLVDVAADAAANPTTTEFAGLIPEVTDKA